MSPESRIWEIRPFGSMRGRRELVIGLAPFNPASPAYSTIGQSPEQIGPIWFAQCNHNGSAMPLECQWNGVIEILVRGDEYGLLPLCVSK
jgi:hypothetical protein